MSRQKKKVSEAGPSASFFNEEGKLFLDALVQESPRGQVLIAAAFLDNALEGCVLAQCKQKRMSEEATGVLLGGHRGILGSLGARIPVCWLLGFIDEGMYKALHAINSIRNDFAHSDFAITFRTQGVREKINVLREWIKVAENGPIYGPVDGVPRWKVDLRMAGETVTAPVTAQHVYLGATVILYVTLHHVRWKIRQGEYDGPVPVTIW